MKTGRKMNKWTGPKKQHISDLSNHMNFKKIPYNETNLDVQVCVCVYLILWGKGNSLSFRGIFLNNYK